MPIDVDTLIIMLPASVILAALLILAVGTCVRGWWYRRKLLRRIREADRVWCEIQMKNRGVNNNGNKHRRQDERAAKKG